MNTDYYINVYYSLEKGFVAHIPDLPECSAVASSPEEAVARVIAKKKEWLDTALEAGNSIPPPRFRPKQTLIFPL